MLLQEDDVSVYSLTLLLNVFSFQMSTEKYFQKGSSWGMDQSY